MTFYKLSQKIKTNYDFFKVPNEQFAIIFVSYISKRETILTKNYLRPHLVFDVYSKQIGSLTKIQSLKLSLNRAVICYYMSEEAINSIACPFNPNHIVPYDRFLNHVDKCKFPGKIHYTKCRFNPYHIIHNAQITIHEEKCPQRTKYQPIEDDNDEWWGVDQESQKTETKVQISIQDKQKDEEQQQIISEDEAEKKKPQKQEKQTKNVEIVDFESLDFSYQGI